LKIAVSIYGSFKTDLSIETSDIDLSINFLNAYNLNKENITNLITDLSVLFEKLFLFEKVVALTNATVPIIKLVRLFFLNIGNRSYKSVGTKQYRTL
jgi:DNA polymerase sigma